MVEGLVMYGFGLPRAATELEQDHTQAKHYVDAS